jgi:hypothetical protein
MHPNLNTETPFKYSEAAKTEVLGLFNKYPEGKHKSALIRALPASLAGAALAISPTAASAQDVPLKILVGFPAGGSIDTIARVVVPRTIESSTTTRR